MRPSKFIMTLMNSKQGNKLSLPSNSEYDSYHQDPTGPETRLPPLEVIFLFVRILAKKLNREITGLARRFTLPASSVYTARSGRVFDRN